MKRVTEALWTTVLPRSPVFTTVEAAAAAGIGSTQASRDLALLAGRHLVSRVAAGVWADTRNPRFSTYAVVPAFVRLSSPGAVGYVSLLSALSLHGMLSQVPRSIYVVCNRRMRRVRRTEFGTYEFYFMQPSLVGGFQEHRGGTFDVATPEKAVFDILYYSVRRGTRFAHLSGVSLPLTFSVTTLKNWIDKIEYSPLRHAVAERWHRLRLKPREQGVA
jgi:predicted transcriptional regulator of viral defense system